MYLHYSKVLHFICPRIYCFCSWSEGRVESQTEVNELLVYFPVWVWETDKKQAVSAAIENLSWCRCAVSQKPQIQQKYNRGRRRKQGKKWSGAKEKNMIYFNIEQSGLENGAWVSLSHRCGRHCKNSPLHLKGEHYKTEQKIHNTQALLPKCTNLRI